MSITPMSDYPDWEECQGISAPGGNRQSIPRVTKKAEPLPVLPFGYASRSLVPLERLHVLCGGAFRALLDVEADTLAFSKRLEALGLDGAVMNKHVAALVLF